MSDSQGQNKSITPDNRGLSGKSDVEFRTMAETLPLALYLSSGKEQVCDYVNPAFVQLFGYTMEDVPSAREWFDKAYPDEDYRKEVEQEWRRRVEKAAIEETSIEPMEVKVCCRDGSIKHVLWGFQNLGEKNYTYGIDLTEQAKAAEALRKSEEKYSTLFNTMLEGFALHEIILDAEGIPVDYRFLDLNPAFERMTGLLHKNVVGKTIREIMPDVERYWIDEYGKVAVTGKPSSFENYSRELKRHFHVEAFSPGINQFAVIVSDVTEKIRMEKDLQRTQKLESIGVFAGGIAHDFNNLMGGVFGYIDIARDICSDPDVISYLDKTMETIDRARALTQQLLTFSKGGAPIRKSTAMAPLLMKTVKFALSGSRSRARFHLDENLHHCMVDYNQIEQVLDNLIINALQAMPEGGNIDIYADNLELKPNEFPDLDGGSYVRICVQDSGTGISREDLPRVFDPFFTTKEKGHGLGLTACFSIVRRHKGYMDVESEIGKGSSFHIYLPATREAAVEGGVEDKSTFKSSGTFIVMDDEKVIRDTISVMLKTIGFSTVCLEDGFSVIEYIRNEENDRDHIRGMIFDLTIPGGMGGKEAIQKVKQLLPHVPVLVTSGYSADPVMSDPEKYGFAASLSKPFRKSELVKTLAGIISSRN